MSERLKPEAEARADRLLVTVRRVEKLVELVVEIERWMARLPGSLSEYTSAEALMAAIEQFDLTDKGIVDNFGLNPGTPKGLEWARNVTLNDLRGFADTLRTVNAAIFKIVIQMPGMVSQAQVLVSPADPRLGEGDKLRRRLDFAFVTNSVDLRWLDGVLARETAKDGDMSKPDTPAERMRRLRARQKAGFSQAVVHYHASDLDTLRLLGLLNPNGPGEPMEIASALESFLQLALTSVHADALANKSTRVTALEEWRDRLRALAKITAAVE